MIEALFTPWLRFCVGTAILVLAITLLAGVVCGLIERLP